MEDMKKSVIHYIGYYYLEKNDYNYSKCHEEIRNLLIHKVEVEDGDCVVVKITTERPGVIIGQYGKDIDALTQYLCDRLGKPFKIRLIEKKDLQWLYPIDCNDYFSDDDAYCDFDEDDFDF